MRRWCVLIGTVGLLGLAACEEAGTTDLAPPFAEAVAFDAASIDYGDMRVADAGSDPKQQLYFDPWPGEQYRVTWIDAGYEIDSYDGDEYEGPTPTDEVTFLIEVRQVLADRIIASLVLEYAACSAEAGTDPEFYEERRAEFEALIGATGVITWSRNGAFIDAKLVPPPGADTEVEDLDLAADALAAALHTFSMPLPNEPVGAGASWTTMANNRVIGGLRYDLSFEPRLVSADDGRIVVERAHTDVLHKQELRYDESEGGAVRVYLRSGEYTTTGTLTYDPAGLPIGAGEISETSKQSAFIPYFGQKIDSRFEYTGTMVMTVERIEQ
jgi:hypothetical protein